MDDWMESTISRAKELYEEGVWTMAAVTPKGRDINKAEMHVFEGSPPKGYIIASHFYKTVVALDQKMNVIKTFSMELDVMGTYAETYEANQGGLPQQDPFEGL